jgi:hypothetical protein
LSTLAVLKDLASSLLIVSEEGSMSKRIFQLLLMAAMMTCTSWADGDPLVGTWKLNPSKCQLTDEMKVQAFGGNKYAFDFGGDKPVTVVTDGSDQPVSLGTTMSVTPEGPSTWKFVSKKDGRMISDAIWRLSADGKELTDAYTVYQPNGSTLRLNYVYRRTAGSSGFAGTWDSTSEKVNSVYEIQIRPYETDGLSFIDLSQQSTQNIKFDGRDYPNHGPRGDYVSSGRRLNDRTLELTNKIEGKVKSTHRIEVSPDGRTLTMTIRPVSRSEPNILVFDRE